MAGEDERDWLVKRQAAEGRQREAVHNLSVWQVLRNPRILTFEIVGFGIGYLGLWHGLLPAADRQAIRADQHADGPGVRNSVRGRCGWDVVVRPAVGSVLERRSHTAVPS